jgi:hypothetical protein
MFRYSTDVENFKLALLNHLSASHTYIEDCILSWKALPVKIVFWNGKETQNKQTSREAEKDKIQLLDGPGLDWAMKGGVLVRCSMEEFLAS